MNAMLDGCDLVGSNYIQLRLQLRFFYYFFILAMIQVKLKPAVSLVSHSNTTPNNVQPKPPLLFYHNFLSRVLLSLLLF